MRKLFQLLVPCLALATFPDSPVRADGAHDDVTRKRVVHAVLPDEPGMAITAVTVELPPGHVADSHRHESEVFVYMLAGQVRSRLAGELARNYSAGDSWIEPAGSLHTLTENLSPVKPAKFLAIFVGRDGAPLSTPAETE